MAKKPSRDLRQGHRVPLKARKQQAKKARKERQPSK